MTWSYSGDPSFSAQDAVRYLLGDTDTTDQLPISDEEISWLLVEWDNPYFAAAAAAEQVAGQFAREVSYSADGVSYGGNELQDKYMALAGQLRLLGKRKGRLGMPYDGSNDPRYNDWRKQVEEIGIGVHDNRRDGANMDEDSGPSINPILGGDGGLAVG